MEGGPEANTFSSFDRMLVMRRHSETSEIVIYTVRKK